MIAHYLNKYDLHFFSGLNSRACGGRSTSAVFWCQKYIRRSDTDPNISENEAPGNLTLESVMLSTSTSSSLEALMLTLNCSTFRCSAVGIRRAFHASRMIAPGKLPLDGPYSERRGDVFVLTTACNFAPILSAILSNASGVFPPRIPLGGLHRLSGFKLPATQRSPRRNPRPVIPTHGDNLPFHIAIPGIPLLLVHREQAQGICARVVVRSENHIHW